MIGFDWELYWLGIGMFGAGAVALGFVLYRWGRGDW